MSGVSFGDNLPNGDAYYIPRSVEVDSAGQHIKEHNLLFLWYWDEFDSPVLCNTIGIEAEISALIKKCRPQSVANLQVQGNVPIISNSAAGKMKKSSPKQRPGIEVARNHSRPFVHNRYTPITPETEDDGGNRRSQPGAPGATDSTTIPIVDLTIDEKPQKLASKDVFRSYHDKKTGKLIKRPIPTHNYITHIPASPESCQVCAIAKMRRQQARRQKNKTKPTPSYHAGIFNELKTIDLVDPGSLDVKHNRYLMTVRDDCTGWVETYPVKSKEADVTAVALIEDARRAGKFADAYRTDNGNEWKGRFDQELASRLVPCFKGLPYRPTTDSRHERWHATLQPGVRSNLLQSGLPHRYYGMAAEHFTY